MEKSEVLWGSIVVLIATMIVGACVFSRQLDHRAMHQCIDRGGSPVNDGCDIAKVRDAFEQNHIVKGLEDRNEKLKNQLDHADTSLKILRAENDRCNRWK